ncbi:MAG TPA: hypothetical protein V6D37_02415 [Candidatus Sericytochromatia bacterium]
MELSLGSSHHTKRRGTKKRFTVFSWMMSNLLPVNLPYCPYAPLHPLVLITARIALYDRRRLQTVNNCLLQASACGVAHVPI